MCIRDRRISVTQRQSVLDALELIKAGKSAAEVREILEKEKFESSIYIMMDTLKYLKKGGRITPAAAAIATVLRIRPVLQIQGEKLDAFKKARSEKQGREIMVNAIQDDIEKRFGGMDQILSLIHISPRHRLPQRQIRTNERKRHGPPCLFKT